MQFSYAAEPAGRLVDDVVDVNQTTVPPLDDAGTGPLRHELRTNLVVAGFSLGLSVAVAVGLSLLMTLLG